MALMDDSSDPIFMSILTFLCAAGILMGRFMMIEVRHRGFFATYFVYLALLPGIAFIC